MFSERCTALDLLSSFRRTCSGPSPLTAQAIALFKAAAAAAAAVMPDAPWPWCALANASRSNESRDAATDANLLACLTSSVSGAVPSLGILLGDVGVLLRRRSGDGEREYETFTGQTRRGLHHTQLGVSTSVLSHQGPGLTDSLVSLVL